MENITEILLKYNTSVDILGALLSDLENGEELELCPGRACKRQDPELGSAGIISLVLGSVAIAFNILSLLAITKVKHAFTTHFRLIASLACSDLLLGASVVCHHLHRVTLPSYPPGLGPADERLLSRCLFMLIKALNSTSLLTTLFNLLGMAIDHYVAVMKPFHYQKLLTRVHGWCMIITFWVLGILLGFSDFYIESWAVPKIQKLYNANFCEAIWITRYQEEYWVFASTVVTGISMMCIYIRIYREIRLLQQEELNNGGLRCRVRRRSFYRQRRKSLATTMLIVCTFLVCWLPVCVLQVTLILFLYLDPRALIKYIFILQTLNNHLFNLLLLNTIMDPIIYAVRITHIRRGYRRLFDCLLKPSCLSRVHFGGTQSSLTSSLRSRNNTSDFPRCSAAERRIFVSDSKPCEGREQLVDESGNSPGVSGKQFARHD